MERNCRFLLFVLLYYILSFQYLFPLYVFPFFSVAFETANFTHFAYPIFSLHSRFRLPCLSEIFPDTLSYPSFADSYPITSSLWCLWYSPWFVAAALFSSIILSLLVSKEGTVGKVTFAVYELLPLTQCGVLRNAPCFLLRKGTYDGDRQFTFGIQYIDAPPSQNRP